MPETETGRDPIGAFRGMSIRNRLLNSSSATIEFIKNYNYIPPYQSTNVHWEITFRALGWNRETTGKFWAVFCRINRSLSGEIDIMEFLTYFNMDRTPYIEKCFEYFDTTGGNSIDFLEFMVSVWNVCPLKIDTLTNFAFDMYDTNNDGELSFPEIERMVEELYGQGAAKEYTNAKEVQEDITVFAEERGGSLDLTGFTIYTMNHPNFLFPIFHIQRTIQNKVMGMRYWEMIERKRPENFGKKEANVFDPRHVQILLRTYKTGGAAAVLSHTGDPNSGLREWFEKQDDALPFIKQNAEEETRDQKNSWWAFLKEGVAINGTPMKDVVKKLKGQMKEKKPAENLAMEAFLNAGKKAKEGDEDTNTIQNRPKAGKNKSGSDEVQKNLETAETAMKKFRSRIKTDMAVAPEKRKEKQNSEDPQFRSRNKTDVAVTTPRKRVPHKESLPLEQTSSVSEQLTEKGNKNDVENKSESSALNRETKLKPSSDTSAAQGKPKEAPKNERPQTPLEEVKQTTELSGKSGGTPTKKKRKTPLRRPNNRVGNNRNAMNVRQRAAGSIISADAKDSVHSQAWLPPPKVGFSGVQPGG